MGIWRVSGSTCPQNLAVVRIIAFSPCCQLQQHSQPLHQHKQQRQNQQHMHHQHHQYHQAQARFKSLQQNGKRELKPLFQHASHNSSSSNGNSGLQTPHIQALTSSFPSSRGSSTRAEHERSRERTSSKRRPRQQSSSVHDSADNLSDMGPSQKECVFDDLKKVAGGATDVKALEQALKVSPTRIEQSMELAQGWCLSRLSIQRGEYLCAAAGSCVLGRGEGNTSIRCLDGRQARLAGQTVIASNSKKCDKNAR
eukprot:1158742-Pelagomonas_calceolata.AAC.3